MFSFFMRISAAIAIVLTFPYFFGNTFMVGWVAYIVYNITDALIINALKEQEDEAK